MCFFVSLHFDQEGYVPSSQYYRRCNACPAVSVTGGAIRSLQPVLPEVQYVPSSQYYRCNGCADLMSKEFTLNGHRHQSVKGIHLSCNLHLILSGHVVASTSKKQRPAYAAALQTNFQKAFDKVPQERLTAEVEVHGIQGNYSRWIRNWLTGRTQRVVIHNQAYDSTLAASGVHQGSVLGPLLFVIYMNDLDVGIISKINKFADDMKLCHKASTEKDSVTIQSNLDRLLQWTETWQMSFNVDKFSVMHVGANNRHFQHTMNDIPIETVQQQMNLGVIVTENVKNDKQVEKSVKNASRVLDFIARNFEYKSRNIISPLYKALVWPHLEYAVQLWSPTLRRDFNKLEKIQPEVHEIFVRGRHLRHSSSLEDGHTTTLRPPAAHNNLKTCADFLGKDTARLEGQPGQT
ncbi:Reverse transcriptase domain [Trinorchestia longiramus]|nr:Reverse transcriptase domain [Trinorchestia longiramus]